jgi:hypothetical protein
MNAFLLSRTTGRVALHSSDRRAMGRTAGSNGTAVRFSVRLAFP